MDNGRERLAATPVAKEQAEEQAYPGLENADEWPAGPRRVMLELRSIGKGPDGNLVETSERLVFGPEAGLDDVIRMPLEVRELVARARMAWSDLMTGAVSGG